ncbi:MULTISPECIES: hypothetical protein [unclassified Tatumella]|uniref:hypothetical protein n=1 Tax=unclassified Tatumella TaxID=2649542 RepID=UPI001BAFDFE5|nr:MULTISPECIES: hypothetical protein [unclassified Tatumella]MBS0857673.1 hypothetical protein [Tatumella sp. JGM16]MBS0914372.1 hypothetical protein [Tatumella sp. JGM91]
MLKGKVSRKITDSLHLINDCAGKASHYSRNREINNSTANKLANEAINLYLLVIIDELEDRDLYFHQDRATLISVLLPDMRVEIYSNIIDFSSNEIDLNLLWKWALACVKNNNSNKARRKLHDLNKKGRISKDIAVQLTEGLKDFQLEMEKGTLPIPRNRADFARNLNDALKALSINEDSMEKNKRLIKILKTMASDIEPSSMGDLKGMRKF